MSKVEVLLLGPIEVAVERNRIAIPRPRVRALLAALAIDVGSPVSKDRLIDRLWGDQPPKDPCHTLHVYINRVRSVHAELAGAVRTTAGGYLLDQEQVQIDTHHFEQLACDGRRNLNGDPAASLRLLNDALGLWRGSAFGDLHYEEFVAGTVLRLQELRLGAVEDRCDAEIRLNNELGAIPQLLELHAAHPLRERPMALLLEALRLAGRTTEAVEAYRMYRSELTSSYGLDPSPAVKRLVARIVG